ncbi:MAG: AMP-binding protein [Gammaproteobacteria bacterium]|nr:AMP-binding protein [Gammaproteobacteria bacterium]
MSKNFAVELQTAFAAHPDRACLMLADGRVWRFNEMQHTVTRFARVLVDHGVEPGARVLAQVDKSPESLALYLACLQVGGAFVPVNTAYTAEEVAYFLEDAAPALFVHRAEGNIGSTAITGRTATLTLDGSGSGTLTDAANAAVPLIEVAERTGDDLAAIVYTSGTTGASKGAMLTHSNLSSNAHALRECWGWQDDDVLLHALPVFHVHGLFIALHCALLGGTTTIFLSSFKVDELLAHLPEATVMMGVPTFYTRLLDQPGFDATCCERMRVFISGSAPLTEQTFAAWEKRTGHRILERYGMTETIINTSNPLVGERVAGTVGFALPGVEVRIADDDGNKVPDGDVGTIEVRGPNVFKGYWHMPEKTAEEFRADGYFITGDLGVMNAQGRVSIVGRAKDMIISGGYNVYPKEVEKLIDEMHAVVESAVIGVPHMDFGEGVVAIVVPAADPVAEPAVREALQDRLARFKQPKIVVNVASLPRNAMGKVQKNLLRQQYADLFDDSSVD